VLAAFSQLTTSCHQPHWPSRLYAIVYLLQLLSRSDTGNIELNMLIHNTTKASLSAISGRIFLK